MNMYYSKTLMSEGVKASSATIRNDMKALEDEGLLLMTQSEPMTVFPWICTPASINVSGPISTPASMVTFQEFTTKTKVVAATPIAAAPAETPSRNTIRGKSFLGRSLLSGWRTCHHPESEP